MLVGSMKLNEKKIDYKAPEAEKINVNNIQHDGFKPTNSLHWRSVLASVRQRLMLPWWSN